MRHLFQLAVLGLILLSPGVASATITYQGQLQRQGQPFSGEANLQFLLFDAAIGGSQVGSTLTRPDWPVEEGLFQVELNFGSSAFDQQPRFLEVRVEGTVLGPRQAVRAAPFALFSLRTQNESPWETATGGNFIRYPAGRVGIGFSANPRAGLESRGTGINGIWGESDSSTGILGRTRGVQATGVVGQAMPESTSGTGVYGEAWATSGVTTGVRGRSRSVSGTGVYGWASADTGTTHAVRGDVLSPAGYAAYFTGATGSRNYFQRRVGIGTLNPAAMLEVAGGGNLIQATHSNGHVGIIGDINAAVYGRRGGDGFTARAWLGHSSSNAGILAQAGSADGAVAGRFEGNVTITGLVSGITLGASGGPSVCRNSSNQLAFCSSSQRYKQDIEALDGARVVELLAALRPVRYHWIDDDRADIGLVAEEVADVIPEIVIYDEEGQVEGFEYNRLGALLVAGFQQQTVVNAERFAALEKEHQRLATENTELRAEVAMLNDQSGQLRELSDRNADLERRLAGLESVLLESDRLAVGIAE